MCVFCIHNVYLFFIFIASFWIFLFIMDTSAFTSKRLKIGIEEAIFAKQTFSLFEVGPFLILDKMVANFEIFCCLLGKYLSSLLYKLRLSCYGFSAIRSLFFCLGIYSFFSRLKCALVRVRYETHRNRQYNSKKCKLLFLNLIQDKEKFN